MSIFVFLVHATEELHDRPSDVQCNWEDFGEPREGRVGRQDRQIPPLGDRADQEIGIGPLHASRAARVDMLGGAFEVGCLDWFVREWAEMIPQPLEHVGRTYPAKQL